MGEDKRKPPWHVHVRGFLHALCHWHWRYMGYITGWGKAAYICDRCDMVFWEGGDD